MEFKKRNSERMIGPKQNESCSQEIQKAKIKIILHFLEGFRKTSIVTGF